MNKETVKGLFPGIYRIWHYFRLVEIKRKEREKKKSYKLFGYEVLADLFEMVRIKGYKISCYYGTLLGIVRDNQLIPWDDDLDFIILADNTFSWEDFERDMSEAGFWKYRVIERENKIVAQSYKKKGVLCDFGFKNTEHEEEYHLYGCYQIAGNIYCNGTVGLYKYWKCKVPKTETLINRNLAGISLQIPDNYESVLSAFYGENWHIPDPNFKQDREEVQILNKITYYKKR
jgi:phosphorylcholine metabolism protein LicD